MGEDSHLVGEKLLPRLARPALPGCALRQRWGIHPHNRALQRVADPARQPHLPPGAVFAAQAGRERGFPVGQDPAATQVFHVLAGVRVPVRG